MGVIGQRGRREFAGGLGDLLAEGIHHAQRRIVRRAVALGRVNADHVAVSVLRQRPDDQPGNGRATGRLGEARGRGGLVDAAVLVYEVADIGTATNRLHGVPGAVQVAQAGRTNVDEGRRSPGDGLHLSSRALGTTSLGGTGTTETNFVAVTTCVR